MELRNATVEVNKDESNSESIFSYLRKRSLKGILVILIFYTVYTVLSNNYIGKFVSQTQGTNTSDTLSNQSKNIIIDTITHHFIKSSTNVKTLKTVTIPIKSEYHKKSTFTNIISGASEGISIEGDVSTPKPTAKIPTSTPETTLAATTPAKRTTRKVSNWVATNLYYNYNVQKEEPLDKKQTCVLPQFHPFDERVVEFVKEHVLSCKIVQKYQFLTFVDTNGMLVFNESEYKTGEFNKKKLKCKYSELVRDNRNPVKDYKTMKSNSFNGSCSVSNMEFVEVSCNIKDDKVYYNIHTNVRKVLPMPTNTGDTALKYNVLVFGIDSLSRLNAMRQLPKSYSYMKDFLKGFIFRGHQKVGGNTYPNMATMLTGYQPMKDDLPFKPHGEEKKPHDPWPFLWKNYSKAGYRTLFAEDDPTYNAFHYSGGGFKAKPTDYYLRTFWTAVEDSKLFRKSTDDCFGNQAKHPLHMDYIRKVIKKLNGELPLFAFSWLTKICHAHLNTVGMADKDILNFFKHLHENGYLNNTVLFFLSDHGNRFGKFRKTYIGSVEDKMPLCSLYLPERFIKSQPHAIKNLQTNVMRPTSAYDIYCTLIEVLKLSVNGSYKTGEYKTKYGISMFGEIPQNRTCDDAGIMGSFCTCDKEVTYPVNNNTIKAANFLVSAINNMILSKYNNFSLCSKLELHNVTRSKTTKSQEIIEKRFRISFETSPSNGTFEGYVSTADFTTFNLIGEIERTNRYGNQSRCINDRILRAYCYCK